jgi:hypothetical protein
MSKVQDLHRKWPKDPKYRKAHAALTAEFELARAVIAARAAATGTRLKITFEPSRPRP